MTAVIRAASPDADCRRELDGLLIDAAARAGASSSGGRCGAGRRGAAGDARRRSSTPRAGGDEPAARVSSPPTAGGHAGAALALRATRRRPSRWASAPTSRGRRLVWLGEMHVRRGRYIGVAPVPGGLANVCLVVREARARAIGAGWFGASSRRFGLPNNSDRIWRSWCAAVTVLGPLAIDVSGAGAQGLLLAGDAAGFVDPMTGDGLRFAMAGPMAAAAALDPLEGQVGAHLRLASWRRQELGAKLRVNRVLRSLVAEPMGVSTAASATRVWPGLLTKLVGYAGDVHLCRRHSSVLRTLRRGVWSRCARRALTSNLDPAQRSSPNSPRRSRIKSHTCGSSAGDQARRVAFQEVRGTLGIGGYRPIYWRLCILAAVR